MNMYQLFKKLPRDLQWEVLTEFVGTHAVRKGKLIKKIAYYTHNNHLERLDGDTFVPVINAVRVRQTLPWINRKDPRKLYIRFRSPKQVQFVEEAVSGDTIVCYRKVIDHIEMWELNFSPSQATVVLPPFVKHVYPSYEYTAKKNKLRIGR